jgi:uncharacterized membrane protein YccF (DUF307 family)
MSVLGNILWIFLGGGIFLFFEYIFGGIILCITIVGIPFGLQCFKLAVLALMPFGREAVDTESSSGCLAIVMNVLWILIAGIEIALTHLIFGLFCAITIIGIPFTKQHIKLAGLALTPFGKEIR